MYQQVETEPMLFRKSGEVAHPVATLQDEHGERYHILVDDHCYVLCHEMYDGTVRPVTHIFREVFELLKTLPTPE